MEWHFYFMWVFAVAVNTGVGLVLIMTSELVAGLVLCVLGLIWFFIFLGVRNKKHR